MSDYISRQAAIDKAGNCYDSNGHLLYAVGTGDLMLIPAADVVEVVRCKDCEHGQSYNMFGSRYCLKHNDVAVKDNAFCSYGERAEE